MLYKFLKSLRNFVILSSFLSVITVQTANAAQDCYNVIQTDEELGGPMEQFTPIDQNILDAIEQNALRATPPCCVTSSDRMLVLACVLEGGRPGCSNQYGYDRCVCYK